MQIFSNSTEDTVTQAQAVAQRLSPGAVLALHGELGAGKTCFIRGLARGLGVTGPVSSPTFTLINEYHGRLPLYHVDLYRIHSEEEALAMGLDDYLYGQGVTAIEWAERVAALLPQHTTHIHIREGDRQEQRRIYMEGIETQS